MESNMINKLLIVIIGIIFIPLLMVSPVMAVLPQDIM